MRIQKKVLRDSALINATTIIIAGIALLSLKLMVSLSSDHAFDAFLPSLILGVGACFTLFTRRLGQAHSALGVYLLAIGGAIVILPRLLLTDYGQNDFDALPILLGPFYLLVGSVLLVISLINHRHWMHSLKTMLVRTSFLAGPGAFLTIVGFIVLGSNVWRATPFGLEIIVASWIVGLGIFLAGSRFVKEHYPDTSQETFRLQLHQTADQTGAGLLCGGERVILNHLSVYTSH